MSRLGWLRFRPISPGPGPVTHSDERDTEFVRLKGFFNRPFTTMLTNGVCRLNELARAGVPPATAQKLAQHSDVNLMLGTYTRLEMTELGEAVNRLPALKTSRKRWRGVGSDDRGELPTDPDIARIAAAWLQLQNNVRTAIMNLIDGGSERGTGFLVRRPFGLYSGLYQQLTLNDAAWQRATIHRKAARTVVAERA